MIYLYAGHSSIKGQNNYDPGAVSNGVTEAELTTYASDRGITIATVDKTTLLIKAMDYIEVQLFKGVKTVSTQALQFSRVLCST